jgi:acyl-coenzyme A thioesterase 13
MTDTAQTNPRLEFFHSQIGNDLSHSISPLGRWLNGIMRAVGYGHISVEFLIREDMTNPMGVLHGGSAAAMMDEVIGMMVFALGREYGYSSVNLNCDFLNAARLGDILIANAKVVRAGRNIVHCECELVTAEGKIIAKCSSNLIQTGVKLPE